MPYAILTSTLPSLCTLARFTGLIRCSRDGADTIQGFCYVGALQEPAKQRIRPSAWAYRGVKVMQLARFATLGPAPKPVPYVARDPYGFSGAGSAGSDGVA